MTRPSSVALVFLGVAVGLPGCGVGGGPAGEPVLLRAEALTVTPSTGPVTHVQVHNPNAATWRGTVSAEFPPGWKVNQAEQSVTVGPRQTARVAFAIERGVDAADNRYPVRLTAAGGGRTATREQTIVCASAPYYKPTIDGKLDDWADAIPATFVTAGKRTTISTYWSRRSFSLLVAVEEDALVQPSGNGQAVSDAVQLSLAPHDAMTPETPSGTCRRYEFVLVPAGEGGRCCARIRPGESASLAAEARPLAGREVEGAELAVVRQGGLTYYECAIPLAAMPTLRPDPGREFCFSLLVHDPDGTGLRDWGAAAGLWPHQRSRLAWCDFPGAKWPDEPPFDNKIEWGFCSSKH